MLDSKSILRREHRKQFFDVRFFERQLVELQDNKADLQRESKHFRAFLDSPAVTAVCEPTGALSAVQKGSTAFPTMTGLPALLSPFILRGKLKPKKT